MADRLDLVIFGATGFTGKCAVKNMFTLNKEYPELTWGVAGRSKSKLEALLHDMSAAGQNIELVKIIIADITDEASLKAMCSQAKVIASCCGPYRFYGEPVVKAAVENGSHFVDVCGEPMFIETMQVKYHEKAKDAGVYIVSACGFDAIPNDMGVTFLQQNFGGVLNSVESYLSLKIDPEVQAEAAKTGLAHIGTWESLIYGLAEYEKRIKLRQQMYSKPMPALEPKLKSRFCLHKRLSQWCLPFMGADRSIVYRTQRFMNSEYNQRPVQFRPYIKMPNLLSALGVILGCVFLFILSKFSFTRSLLKKYPEIFTLGAVTKKGPSEKVMEGSSCKFILIGVGWNENTDVNKEPNKKVIAKVSCRDPGYGMTGKSLLLCGITILKENDKMPGKGGVLTTGAAFANTNLIKTLNEHEFTFEIVKQDVKQTHNEQLETEKNKAE